MCVCACALKNLLPPRRSAGGPHLSCFAYRYLPTAPQVESIRMYRRRPLFLVFSFADAAPGGKSHPRINASRRAPLTTRSISTLSPSMPCQYAHFAEISVLPANRASKAEEMNPRKQRGTSIAVLTFSIL